MKTTHTHHIVPKHMGGSDDPSNLVELTVEEHAEAHRVLFEQYGRWQDQAAWQLLSGRVGRDAILKTFAIEAKRELMKDPEWIEMVRTKKSIGLKKFFDNGGKPWNKGKKCPILSERAKKQVAEGRYHCIGDFHRGKTFSDEHKASLKAKAKLRPILTCEHCGTQAQPGMFARWHGDNCRRRRS